MDIDVKSLGVDAIVKITGKELDRYFHVNDARTFVIARIALIHIDTDMVSFRQLFPRSAECPLCSSSTTNCLLDIDLDLFKSNSLIISKASNVERDIAVLTT